MMKLELIEELKRDEGFRGKPYKDTVGKLTIGYGRNLDDNPLTEQEAEILLINDLEKILYDACKLNYYSELTLSRQSVILNMIYNLGINRFMQFKKMNAAISVKNYELAAMEMLDSKWAKQVGDRAVRLSNIMRHG